MNCIYMAQARAAARKNSMETTGDRQNSSLVEEEAPGSIRALRAGACRACARRTSRRRAKRRGKTRHEHVKSLIIVKSAAMTSDTRARAHTHTHTYTLWHTQHLLTKMHRYPKSANARPKHKHIAHLRARGQAYTIHSYNGRTLAHKTCISTRVSL